MGMGMKSLKWEGIGTKNLFPHTSTAGRAGPAQSVTLLLLLLLPCKRLIHWRIWDFSEVGDSGNLSERSERALRGSGLTGENEI